MKFTHESEIICWALIASGCMHSGHGDPAERAEKAAAVADAVLLQLRKRMETRAESDSRERAEDEARNKRRRDEEEARRAAGGSQA